MLSSALKIKASSALTGLRSRSPLTVIVPTSIPPELVCIVTLVPVVLIAVSISVVLTTAGVPPSFGEKT